MAAIDTSAWIPEEFDSAVVQRVNKVSVVEAVARRIPMGSLTKSEPRSAGAGVATVAKSAAYGEDNTANDAVLLTAVKFGEIFRIPQEDLGDNIVNVIATKQRDWATSYAKLLDNACLGTSAAGNLGTVPFNSLYRALTTNDTNAGYTANANLSQTTNATLAGSGGYDVVSSVLALVESSDYWDDGSMMCIAHPAFKKILRGIKDNQGRPIFVGGQGGDSGQPDHLFDLPVRYSLGAKVTATASSNPGASAHPLLYVANPDLMFLGVRSGPESATAPADSGAAFTTDEALLKMRSRRGFVTANPNGFAVLEITG